MILPDFLENHSDGEIRVVGHRVSLDHIVTSFREGASAEMIALLFDTISLATIYKTIGYFLENEAEVNIMIAKNQAAADELRAKIDTSPGVVDVRRRLQARRLAEIA